MCVGTRVATTD